MSRLKSFLFVPVFWSLFFSVPLNATEFEIIRPSKLSIPSKIKMIFIDPALFDDSEDQLKIKNEVIVSLKRKLNSLGRFKAIIGSPKGFDPNLEVVGVIQGDIISGAEIDEGQFTQKAVCKGAISGLVGSLTAKKTTEQGLTVSRRKMLCKKPSLTTKLVESGVSAGLGMIGLTEFARVDEVIRVYKYKNFSLFAQLNLSLTQIGNERETLAIIADASSFNRHVINPDTFKNVRESGDNAGIIWLWFRLTPVAPVIQKNIGIVSESNPGSFRGKRYSRNVPEVKDLPAEERKEIINGLVENTIQEFLRTVSPYRTKITTEIASDGNDEAVELLDQGQFEKAKAVLQGAKKPEDLYNLGLAIEATATTMEDYEEALIYYNQAFDKDPGIKLYAQGIGRMEFQLRAANRVNNN